MIKSDTRNLQKYIYNYYDLEEMTYAFIHYIQFLHAAL